MKVHYVEHSTSSRTATGVLVPSAEDVGHALVDTATQKLNEAFFAGTPFAVPARPEPAAANQR